MRGIRFLVLCCSIGLCIPPIPSQAELWAGFYRSTKPAAAPARTGLTVSGTSAVCLSEILSAQQRYGIPNNLLLAIGLQEAGRNSDQGLTVWPWTVNAAGEGRFFADRSTMLNWVESKQNQGTRSIDVGCMQINLRWHANAFASVEHAVDPAANVDYAARYLVSHYADTGDWWEAAGRYHSSTEEHKAIYLSKLEQNARVATKSYAEIIRRAGSADTPSTSTPATAPKLAMPDVFWGTTSKVVEASGSPRYSIYSSSPLLPLLPDYKEKN